MLKTIVPFSGSSVPKLGTRKIVRACFLNCQLIGTSIPQIWLFFDFENSTQSNLLEEPNHAKITKLPLYILEVATFPSF